MRGQVGAWSQGGLYRHVGACLLVRVSWSSLQGGRGGRPQGLPGEASRRGLEPAWRGSPALWRGLLLFIFSS